MYASLTLFARRLTMKPIYLLISVIGITALMLACGSDLAEQATQVPPSHTQMPVKAATTAPASNPAPTSTQAPTATIAPTPTETPYWAKKIIPGIAMEQYPPLNNRTDYELRNTQEWLNGKPTTIKEIRDRGRVVVVDFWTYT